MGLIMKGKSETGKAEKQKTFRPRNHSKGKVIEREGLDLLSKRNIKEGGNYPRDGGRSGPQNCKNLLLHGGNLTGKQKVKVMRCYL